VRLGSQHILRGSDLVWGSAWVVVVVLVFAASDLGAGLHADDDQASESSEAHVSIQRHLAKLMI
jgi:hypothetical protein